MPDHVHMLVSIPPKYAVAQVVGYLKGKSAIPHCADVPRASSELRGSACFGPAGTSYRRWGETRRRSASTSGIRNWRTSVRTSLPCGRECRPWAAPSEPQAALPK